MKPAVVLHITRGEWPELGANLCNDAYTRSYSVHEYYLNAARAGQDRFDTKIWSWCSECLGYLTPMDELANTDL